MKKHLLMFIVATATLAIAVPSVMYVLTIYYQNKCKKLYKEASTNYEIKYAYDLTSKALNQSFYGKNKDEGFKLYEYYKHLQAYNDSLNKGLVKREKIYNFITEDSGYVNNIFIPVPISNQIGVEQEVYIKSIAKGDSVAKGYVFNTYCWGWYEAYFATNTLYDTPPNDTLLKQFYKHVKETASKPVPGFGQPSPYGFYCN